MSRSEYTAPPLSRMPDQQPAVASELEGSSTASLKAGSIMTNSRKRGGGHSLLAEILAVRLQQLERQSPLVETFVAKMGVGRGTHFDLVNAQGNPTLRTIEHVATRLDGSLFELIGFTADEVRNALKRHEIDYDDLKAKLAERQATEPTDLRSYKRRK